MPPAKPDRYARYCQRKLDNVNKSLEPNYNYFLSDSLFSVEMFVYIGGRELKYSMDSTNSWPPLDASKETMEAFLEAAFDKERVVNVFDAMSNIIDFGILFDQPTSHPKFRAWIRFLYRKLLMREWETHVREINGMEEKEESIKVYVEKVLTEWKSSSLWVSLSPEECPVRYDISYDTPKCGYYDDIEYKQVIIPKDPPTQQKYHPDLDKHDPRYPTKEAGEEVHLTDGEIKKEGREVIVLKDVSMMEEAKPRARKEPFEHKEELKEANKEIQLQQDGRAKINAVENVMLPVRIIKKEAKQEIELTREPIKKEVKEEVDLTGTSIKKESKTWVGKRRFDDVEEFERAINDPKISKKPRYRVVQVYEILDSDEE
ncbi:hypothetical protein HYFRA_00005418 [Hymenoscyphus fraxineus]|uniref:Uncharacterized protein n=1 Tax=Hymenoscyphus fraxineus TaxID=746836 RepID=A0A9N9KRE3_9HELO|nr:hypothetical protein HYFRA_00005418 [Hymenoscyphus fraxineus]